MGGCSIKKLSTFARLNEMLYNFCVKEKQKKRAGLKGDFSLMSAPFK